MTRRARKISRKSGKSPERPAADAVLPDVNRQRDRIALVLAIVIYSGLSAWMAVASKGFLEADGITHYLSRRFALTQPLHLVSIWSRPLCVALYMVPSYFGGLLGTRLESLALVLLTVPLTIGIARRLGVRRPMWAGLFLLTQPLLFAHSFSELTEVPFALLLAAAFYAYQRKWFGWMAALIALAPLGRPEGFGLLFVAAVALVLHRRWLWLLVLPLGVAAWSYAGWHYFGETHEYPWWKYLPRNWPYSPESVYGHGDIFKLGAILPAVVGPIAFGFAVFGIATLLRHGRSSVGSLSLFFTSHRARCRALAWAIPIGVLAVHSILWATGKMASNGEPRYLLIAAPFWALLAAAGLDALTTRFGWRRPLLFVLANAILPIAANRIYPCFPLGPQDDDRLSDTVAIWMNEHQEIRDRYPKTYAWMPHFYMKFDLDKLDSKSGGQPTKAQARLAAPGTLMLWDSTYAMFNSSSDYVVPRDLLAEAGWKAIWITKIADPKDPAKDRVAIVYLSPLDKDGRPFDSTDAAK